MEASQSALAVVVILFLGLGIVCAVIGVFLFNGSDWFKW